MFWCKRDNFLWGFLRRHCEVAVDIIAGASIEYFPFQLLIWVIISRGIFYGDESCFLEQCPPTLFLSLSLTKRRERSCSLSFVGAAAGGFPMGQSGRLASALRCAACLPDTILIGDFPQLTGDPCLSQCQTPGPIFQHPLNDLHLSRWKFPWIQFLNWSIENIVSSKHQQFFIILIFRFYSHAYANTREIRMHKKQLNAF